MVAPRMSPLLAIGRLKTGPPLGAIGSFTARSFTARSFTALGSRVTSLLCLQTASRTHTTSLSLAIRPMLVSWVLLACLQPANADRADDYLAGLRQRGWHDTVLEYLDEAEQDPIATPAFLEKLEYERAITQIALARQALGDRKQQALLAEAADALQRFAAGPAASPLQLQALATAGNIFNEQALLATNKAEQLPAAARTQREPLLNAARKSLEQAERPLNELLRLSNKRLESLPKAAEMQKDPAAQANRRQLLAKQAEAKFLLAKLSFEKSRTYAPDSKDRQQALESAADAFAKVYEEYEEKLVGFFARLYQGRSYQAAGELDDALECYWDIVDQPPIPNQDFRRLVTRAFRYRAECHLASDDLDTAIKECREWLEESRNSERDEPDWLALSFQLAKAYDAKAAQSDGVDAKRPRTEARKLYREVARIPGEFQREAKANIASASGNATDQPIVVETFGEAFNAGKSALEQMSFSQQAQLLAKENNPDSVESLGDQAKAYRASALQYFHQALQLAEEQTDPEQLVSTQYYLCWLYWETGKLEDAAVLGLFVARRYPESKFAPVAAKLALASYERLYNSAKQSNQPADYEAQELADVAEMLVQRWPESPEAASGLNLLINIALRDDRLSDAEQLLQRLPPASRAGAELRLGGALWTRYLRATSSQAEPDEQTLELKARSRQLLESGFDTLQSSGQASAAEMASVLYYAQLLLASGDAQQAIAALENDSVGPLNLVTKLSPAESQSTIVQETYKVALRAYLSVEPPQREKAQAMMAALESAVGQQDDAQQKLINVYVSLGLQLQQQISTLSAEGHADKARAVATAFEDLLNRVTQRAGAANDWKIQSWIAQTNLQLGQGLRGEDAARYFQQAADAYQALLAQAEADPDFAPSPIAVLATRKRLADCQLAQAEYAAAMQSYVTILREKPNMLELQQAAASALQQWGTEHEDSQKLDDAIRGSMPQANRKNLVWGWLRLAAIADQAKRRAERKADDDPAQVSRVKKYKDLFFEARYHAAEARFAAAMLADGAARKQQLDKARQGLESMKRLYPELGGPRWKAAYLKLLEQMEQEK